jgi:hypothetical protein
MQVSGTSSNYWLQQLQRDLAGFASSLTGAASTGQTAPTSGQDSTSTTSAASSAASTTTGQTTPTTSSPQSLLGSSVLATLIGAQEQSSSQPTEATLANDIAGKIISALDGGSSSGALSLNQVAGAVSQASGTTVTPSSISAAFNQLDTNGDGQLSQSELATALETLAQTQQTQHAQQSQQANGTEPAHHRHHHHGADASPSSSATASDTTTVSTTTTSTSTTSTGAGT